MRRCKVKWFCRAGRNLWRRTHFLRQSSSAAEIGPSPPAAGRAHASNKSNWTCSTLLFHSHSSSCASSCDLQHQLINCNWVLTLVPLHIVHVHSTSFLFGTYSTLPEILPVASIYRWACQSGPILGGPQPRVTLTVLKLVNSWNRLPIAPRLHHPLPCPMIEADFVGLEGVQQGTGVGTGVEGVQHYHPAPSIIQLPQGNWVSPILVIIHFPPFKLDHLCAYQWG